MNDLRKRYEKTPLPSSISGKPFKRPFGNKDKEFHLTDDLNRALILRNRWYFLQNQKD